jgi:pyruvate-ferredoxin/flavodoxin oxidoreductase
MSTRTTMDGNTAVAHVAYRVNEVCAIFPITPSSPMADVADEWASAGVQNIWGNVPVVQEMQAEGGAAGALHGALQSGALTTTFTASQGLMLMLPEHVQDRRRVERDRLSCRGSRSLATSALSIFGDHADVMTARPTGFALLNSASVQEAHDCALIAQMATLESRVPFLHFFDGFRTSHELNTLDLLSDADIRAMIDDDLVRAHRGAGSAPSIRSSAAPRTIPTRSSRRARRQSVLRARSRDRSRRHGPLRARTGGPIDCSNTRAQPTPSASSILMGSGAETARGDRRALCAVGEKVGVLQVRLYRPFSASRISLPRSRATVRSVAVLDRTKEPGGHGRAALSRTS